jgi:hypothetical protein
MVLYSMRAVAMNLLKGKVRKAEPSSSASIMGGYPHHVLSFRDTEELET